MKLLKFIVLLLVLATADVAYSQESTVVPERTPEQEAAMQTEKMQQELKLNAEQARQIHELNLKYARARKISNTRIEAIQRIKDKELEMSRILNDNQQSILKNKRYDRSSFQSSDVRQATSQPNRTPEEYRQAQTPRASTEASQTQPNTTRSTAVTPGAVRSTNPAGNVSSFRSSTQGVPMRTTDPSSSRTQPSTTPRSIRSASPTPSTRSASPAPSMRSSSPAPSTRSASPAPSSSNQGRR